MRQRCLAIQRGSQVQAHSLHLLAVFDFSKPVSELILSAWQKFEVLSPLTMSTHFGKTGLLEYHAGASTSCALRPTNKLALLMLADLKNELVSRMHNELSGLTMSWTWMMLKCTRVLLSKTIGTSSSHSWPEAGRDRTLKVGRASSVPGRVLLGLAPGTCSQVLQDLPFCPQGEGGECPCGVFPWGVTPWPEDRFPTKSTTRVRLLQHTVALDREKHPAHGLLLLGRLASATAHISLHISHESIHTCHQYVGNAAVIACVK